MPNDETEEDVEIASLKKRYMSSEKIVERKQITEEWRLVPKKYV